MDLTPYVATFVAFIATVTTLSELLEKKWHLDGVAARLRSWVVAFLVGFAAFFLKLGLFAPPTDLLSVALYAFGAGLAANGFFSIEVVKAFVQVVMQTTRKKR